MIGTHFCDSCWLFQKGHDTPTSRKWNHDLQEINAVMGFQWRLATRGMESRLVHFSKLAKQHYRRAREMGYRSILDRYENDLRYQESCDVAGYSEDVIALRA